MRPTQLLPLHVLPKVTLRGFDDGVIHPLRALGNVIPAVECLHAIMGAYRIVSSSRDYLDCFSDSTNDV